VNKLSTLNGMMAIDKHDDIVELWRQAVLGQASARRALLSRVMPASERPAAASVIAFAPRSAGRHDRAA
jgi:hypothetical protein